MVSFAASGPERCSLHMALCTQDSRQRYSKKCAVVGSPKPSLLDGSGGSDRADSPDNSFVGLPSGSDDGAPAAEEQQIMSQEGTMAEDYQ